MRIIPKKIKVRNTVWKCYTMPDIIAALIVFAVVFICITAGNWAVAAVTGILAVVMFMPTSEGIFYSCILENVRFLFAKKRYMSGAKKPKENVDALSGLKAVRESGLIEYKDGSFGRVIKLGQKNFGVEDGLQQDTDIRYFASALKQLDETQSADLVKIDRPVTLDVWSKELFARLSENDKRGDDRRDIRAGILRERIDAIDKINNVRKEYTSDYYFVIYGKNAEEVEQTALNAATEIGKCGLSAALLGRRDAAVFLKYGYSRNFDEWEAGKLSDEELVEWIKPKEIVFKANKYVIDGLEASTMAIAEYPLRVKNAWGADLFNIPNTKVVLHMKPVERLKAIRRIDKCIGEMETKQLLSEKASESNSAEIHRETMHELLDSLQTENESLLDVTLTVTAYNYLKESGYKKAVRRAIRTENFRPSMLYGKQIDGFRSSAMSPQSGLKNLERGINSSSLAAVFPFVRIFVMEEGGILLGENRNNRYPFIFDLWKRGNLYQNSNATVIGKSGSGREESIPSISIRYSRRTARPQTRRSRSIRT